MNTTTNQSLAIAPSDSALAAIDPAELARMRDLLADSVTDYRGSPLSPMQRAQLAILALTTGLSPFTGELYMTDVGPQIGVLAYERKAQEYMDAFMPGSSYHLSYRKATTDEAEFDPKKGDVAYYCELTRDDWDERWFQQFSRFMKIAIDAGITGEAAVTFAKEAAGRKPAYGHAGIVFGVENFSGIYGADDEKRGKIPAGYKVGDEKPTKWSRHERAKKRARKGALKHAFPRLAIPDPLKVLADRQADQLIAAAAAYQPPAQPRVPADQLLEEITGQEPIEADHRDPDPAPPVRAPGFAPDAKPARRFKPAQQESPVNQLVRAGLAENNFAAAATINKLQLAGQPWETIEATVGIYREWREAGKDSDEATRRTLAKEIPGEADHE